MGPRADISITRRDKGQIMERKNPQGFQGLEREDKELRPNAVKTRKLWQRNARRKVTQSRWQAQKTIFTQTRHKATFVQACKYGLDVAKMGGESPDSEFSLCEWKSKTARPETFRREDPQATALASGRAQGRVWVTEAAQAQRQRRDTGGRTGSETSQRRCQGDRVRFWLQPRETDDPLYGLQALPHQSSHRKIMSPSNEFMQTVVHLSEVKKMHFHFKMKTLDILSRQKPVSVCEQFLLTPVVWFQWEFTPAELHRSTSPERHMIISH